MSEDITDLLLAWNKGDTLALEKLIPQVQKELHKLANNYLYLEKGNHTLQPTALVNEAYLRLIKWKNTTWNNRAHFFGVAARLMRNILVDHARKNRDRYRIPLEDIGNLLVKKDIDLLDLDDALNSLAAVDQRQSLIIEYHYFGGLTVTEIGAILGISPATVSREEKLAKLWLLQQLKKRD